MSLEQRSVVAAACMLGGLGACGGTIDRSGADASTDAPTITFSSLAVASGQTTAFTLSSDAAVGVYVMSSQTTVAMPITGSGSAVVP